MTAEKEEKKEEKKARAGGLAPPRLGLTIKAEAKVKARVRVLRFEAELGFEGFARVVERRGLLRR